MNLTFRYKARNREGEQVQGTIERESIHQAVGTLRHKGYLVTEIKAPKTAIGLARLNFRPGASSRELALFCRQLATMSGAGLKLVTALGIIVEQHPNPRLRQAVSQLRKDLVGGSQLTGALKGQPGIFPTVLVHMVAAGETGGILDAVLGWMADHFEKEQKLQEKIKGALTYPGVVALVAIAAVVFLAIFVLPTFSNLFISSGLSLPWPTRLLLFVSQCIIGRGHWLVGGGTLVILLGTLFVKTDKGRHYRDRLLLTLPGVGKIILRVGLARICRTMGTLLAGGVPLLTALSVVKDTGGNQVISRFLGDVEIGIRKGSNLSALLADCPLFPPMMVQMVDVGEKTGTLSEMLVQTANYYEQETDYVLTRFSTLLEPVLILVVSGLVGFIVISIMLPLIELVTIVG